MCTCFAYCSGLSSHMPFTYSSISRGDKKRRPFFLPCRSVNLSFSSYCFCQFVLCGKMCGSTKIDPIMVVTLEMNGTEQDD